MQFDNSKGLLAPDFSPVSGRLFEDEELFQQFSFIVCAKAVETAAEVFIVCGSPG